MLFFSKRLDIDDWGVEQVDNCIQMTQIQTSQGLIQLVNVYVMTDEGWITLRSDSALRKMPELFDEESECILLDDFNLHHLFWEGEWVWCTDEIVWELIDMTAQQGLCLATSQKVITWWGDQSQRTTIDLTFLTSELYSHLMQCMYVPRLGREDEESCSSWDNHRKWPEYKSSDKRMLILEGHGHGSDEKSCLRSLCLWAYHLSGLLGGICTVCHELHHSFVQTTWSSTSPQP